MIINNSFKAILLMVLCTIFTSIGQISWKFGINKINLDALMTIFNVPFILGFVLYGVGFLLMLSAFKYGELTVLFPIIATSYVWVSLLSSWLFPDTMNVWKWMGVTLIVFSVSLLGLASKKEKVIVDG